jgi:hypothetical protein
VFGHRCKHEPCGDVYAPTAMADLDPELTAILTALSTLGNKIGAAA